MGVFQNNLLAGAAAAASAGGAAFYDHQIEQSCRFTEAENSYLFKSSLGTPTSLKKGTWSYWFKIHGTLTNNSTPSHVHFASGTSGAAGGYMFFETQQNDPNNMKLNAANLHNLDAGRSDGLYRDPTGWYHLVIKFDSTQSTQSDRLIFYINGSQVSGLSASNVSLNEDLIQWNTSNFIIGAKEPAGHAVNGTDFYFAEWIWVDGTAYAPTQFGESKNGVWIPKDPSGTSFGNNGFHLKFENASDLGNDSSGNNNDFDTVNGLGTDHQVLDSPTFGS